MELIDKAQVTKAVKALVAHMKKNEAKDLLAEERMIRINFGLKKTPTQPPHNPIRVPLTHSLYDADSSEVLLFTKDPEEEFEKLLADKGVSKNIKVMGVSKLKKEYKQFEAKRQLCGSYDLFLSDDRVITLLPSLLGKKFYETKKRPAPVDITKGNLSAELAKAVSSTYVYISTGSCVSVKIGHSGMKAEQIIDNIVNAVPLIVKNLPKKASGVQCIHIQGENTATLPIYNSVSDEPLSGDKRARGAADDDEPVAADKTKKAKKDAALKRPASDEDEEESEEEEKPKTKKGKAGKTEEAAPAPAAKKAAPEAPKTPTVEAKTPKAEAKTPKAEAKEAPKTPKAEAPKTPKAEAKTPKATEAKEAPKTPKATEAPKTPKATEAKEAPKTPKTDKKAAPAPVAESKTPKAAAGKTPAKKGKF